MDQIKRCVICSDPLGSERTDMVRYLDDDSTHRVHWGCAHRFEVSPTWRPMETMPDEFKDGRPLLLHIRGEGGCVGLFSTDEDDFVVWSCGGTVSPLDWFPMPVMP